MIQVSLILPTYNRAESLRAALGCIARQSFPLEALEVIVVDDGSSDYTPQVIAEPYPFRLRYLRQANCGSTTARNTGANESRGELLLFLDDDILIEPGFVAGLVAEHTARERIVGLGTFRPHHVPGESHFRRIYAELTATPGFQAEATFAECTSNAFSVRRDHFVQIGMMQDLIGDGQALWGDVDFGWRAHRLGFTFRRHPEAICYHNDYAIDNFDVYVKRSEKIAAWAVRLIRRYPELADRLPMLADKQPIDLQRDPPRLVVRKLLRRLASTQPVLGALTVLARWLEAHAPTDRYLRPLYRWIVGGYLYRGYRRGLREYQPGPPQGHLVAS